MGKKDAKKRKRFFGGNSGKTHFRERRLQIGKNKSSRGLHFLARTHATHTKN